MSLAYEPSRSISAKISRRITPLMSRRSIPVKLSRPLVSITFDDCPASAIKNGVDRLDDYGWKSSIYVAGGLLGTTNHHGRQISAEDLLDLHNRGHEIGGHTWSHIDAQSVNIETFAEDIIKNKAFMKNLGLPTFRTFAYPYGQTQPAVKRLLESQFDGMRGIIPGIHRKDVDLNQIKSVPLFSGDKMQAAHDILKDIAANPAWVTFFTHDIRGSHSPWGCRPDEFQTFIQAVQGINADVMPVDQAIRFIKERS